MPINDSILDKKNLVQNQSYEPYETSNIIRTHDGTCHCFSLLMILFIKSSAVIATKENSQTILKYNCEAKMDIPCVLEVFNTIFKIGSVTNKSCEELIVLEKVCHSALVQKTLEKPKFQNLDRDTIIQKCIDTWNKCHVLTHLPSPTVTYTKQNDQTILKYNCEAKMGIPCFLEAFNTISRIRSVTNTCWNKLIVLGKVCHSALV
ncbi:hypothetical protein GQ457_02G043120 [Hibiscus cannabinus]